MSYNRVMVLGRLGKDPELSYTKSQMAVCKFSVATSEKRKQGEEWIEETEWHNITAFGKTAENCGKFLSKGREAFIEGKLKTDSWDDKDTGKKRYSTGIIASNVTFVGGRGEDNKNSMPGLDDVPFD